MTEKERDALLDKFAEDILESVLKKLVILFPELRDKNLDEFSEALLPLWREAREGLARLAGVATPEEVDIALRTQAMVLLVLSMNCFLPMDYPYALAIATTIEDDHFMYFPLRRSDIPGFRDILDPAFIPMFEADSVEALEAGELRFKKLVTDHSTDPPFPEFTE